MADEFTKEELKEVIRAARVFNPGFSEDEFQSLMELERHISDSGYLETVRGLRKLEDEKGIPLSQALETHDQLLQENEELAQKVAARNTKLEDRERHLRETEEKLQKVATAVQDATTRLGELRREEEREEKQLETFRNKATREKERINEELAQYRRRANVTEAEVATAGRVKAEVTKHGFNLDLALGVAAEFAGYTNARERLAEALKKQGKLTSYVTTLEADVKALGENRGNMEGIVSRLEGERAQYEAILSQLKAEIAQKGDIVGFYNRYVHLRSLIEYLGSRNQVTFHHCTWCGAFFWVLLPGKVPSSTYKCPWCGFALVEFDKNAYATVSQPPATALKLLQ